jgi:SAM-dependent methyltransferase
MQKLSSFLVQLKEIFYLFILNIQVKWFNLIEFIYVFFKYYGDSLFIKIDLALIGSYFFNNPFKVSKRFLLTQGEQDLYTYGETPLTTLDLIAQECRFSSKDVIYELGCGRGRTCFWLRQFIGCRVIGIDYVPAFIDNAQRIQQQFHVNNISFKLEDFFKASLNEATVIYFYGTCQSATSIQELIKHFSNLTKGTHLITVSYALTDYQANAPFEILKRFSAPFTWGVADVYLQVKQ